MEQKPEATGEGYQILFSSETGKDSFLREGGTETNKQTKKNFLGLLYWAGDQSRSLLGPQKGRITKKV